MNLRAGTELAPVLRWAHEVNERVVDMLVTCARNDQRPSFPLVIELRDLFRAATPLMRERIGRRAYLLVDMELRNVDWWQAARKRPSDEVRTPLWRGTFSRPSAIQLARATLIMAWNTLRTDRPAAQFVLGVSPLVADIITNLKLDEIDRIAQTRFRHVRPRWDDRPAVWRTLLLAARSADDKAMNEFDVHAIQLVAGELMS
jgi:hypothetical protein